MAVQLWHLLQDTGAKSSSVFASSSIFILFWHNVGIPKNVSLLLLGAMDSANSAAEGWEAGTARELFHCCLFTLSSCLGALEPYKIIDT